MPRFEELELNRAAPKHWLPRGPPPARHVPAALCALARLTGVPVPLMALEVKDATGGAPCVFALLQWPHEPDMALEPLPSGRVDVFGVCQLLK